MQEINAWLQSEQDFSKGAELYHKYGTNSFFKSLLSAGPTPYNTDKLRAELKSLAPASPAFSEIDLQPSNDSEIIPYPESRHDSNYRTEQRRNVNAGDHVKYLDLKDQLSDVIKKLDRGMAFLDFSNDQKSLHKTAKEVLKLQRQKEEIWKLIDYYDENGSFEYTEEVEMQPLETRRQLLYQAISRARTRLKNPNCKNREKTEQLIKEKLNQLEELKGARE